MADHAFPEMARKRAEISPDATAFSDAASGRDWSFAEIESAAAALACGLAAAGLQEGDRLAVLMLNRVEVFVLLFAAQKTGIILAPLNWRQPAPELIETLAATGASAIAHDADFADTAGEIAAALGLTRLPLGEDGATRDSDRLPCLRKMMAQPAAPRSPRPVAPDAPWYLLFTSGTTGRPKAVIQTARMAWANAVNITQAARLSGADSSVNYLPLFHTAGINLYTLPLFLAGGRSHVLRRFEEDQLVALIRDGALTRFFGVPAIYQALSLHPAIDTLDLSGLGAGCGGAPLSEPLIRFFAARSLDVCNGFGMTETGPTVFLMDAARAGDKIGSVGRAQMMTEVRLAGVAEGAPGEGEIQLRGPNITPGYFGDAAATRAAFTEDGWLATGDVGRRDGEGYYFVVDRIKDMYISGGENVYPAEVERVLAAHPAVLEAAVIGIPDTRWGETGAAFVLLREGAEADAEVLRGWCRSRLAAYKVPARVAFVRDFPRTAAGKIRKPDLRERMRDAET